jgi:hypothetical protein
VTYRRIRNRLSQRAFRERQLIYIKELEERTKTTAQTESDRNMRLSKENDDLRDILLNCRKQMLGFSCALNKLAGDIGKFFDLETLEDDVMDGENSKDGCHFHL